MIRRRLSVVFLFAGIFTAQILMAQTGISVAKLYDQARKEAFQGKYDLAKKNCEKILTIDKNYTEAAVLLGKINAWQKNYSKAIEVFDKVLSKQPKNQEALSAYVNVLWWQGNNNLALQWANKALLFYPKNEGFLYKKARILLSLKKEKEAQSVLSSILDLNPNDSSARKLFSHVKNLAVYNTVSWQTAFEYFNKPYTNRWYLNNLSYKRKTRIGAVVADFYLADVVQDHETLFGKNVDKLFEISAYPVLGKKNYAYVSYGFGGKELLPVQRAGFELYQKLNHAFDVSLGTRFMQFRINPDSLLNVWILTASLDKYYRNYWFMLRAYLTPHSTGWDRSFILTLRRYFITDDNYVNLDFGMGNSINRLDDYLALYEVYHMNTVSLLLSGQYKISTAWSIKGIVGLKKATYLSVKNRNAFYSTFRLNYSF